MTTHVSDRHAGVRVRHICALALLVAVGGIAAVVYSAERFTYDHMHLAVPDADKATDWYARYVGATRRTDGIVGAMFGGIRFNFAQGSQRAPSAGTVIDHVAISVADVGATVRGLDGSGAKVLEPPRQVPGFALAAEIEDPWGVKIELVQDPDVRGFHHAHVLSTNPEATITWFVERFGGTRGRLNGAHDGVRFGDLWLLVQRVATEPGPSAGSAIDHLGFRSVDIKQAVADLRAGGVVAPDAGEQARAPGTFATFVESPIGRIELTQRP